MEVIEQNPEIDNTQVVEKKEETKNGSQLETE